MYWIARIVVPDVGSAPYAVPGDVSLATGDRCVCELDHVHELGTVQDLTSLDHPPSGETALGKVLRQASADDMDREATSREVAAKAMATFRAFATETQLPVRPMKAHFSLRRERLVLWYSTDTPVDLRQGIGHLQRQFATKVDARAVGAREEAAMLGGCGICGRPLCCATWLRQCPAVHSRMARTQELSVIPGAVNGVCGRLKCCLQYEFEHYAEAAAGMPPNGYLVSWDDGEGIVVARDILARKVTVKSDGRFLTLAVADLHPSRSGHDAPTPANDDDSPDAPGAPHHEDPHP